MTDHFDAITGDGAAATETEWKAIVSAISPSLRRIVAEVVMTNGASLSRRFYAAMMDDSEAQLYLDHELVETRLRDSMQRWLVGLFADSGETASVGMVSHQRHVADSHARIKIPIHLVGRGARLLKHWIWEFLADDVRLDRDDLRGAIIFVNDMIDVAIDIMNASFVSSSDRAARMDEAYRLFSLSQDLAIERERQRASLLEWSQQMTYAVHRKPKAGVPGIGQSGFGLWLTHKAEFMFERAPEILHIVAAVRRIDHQLVPRFAAPLAMEDLSALFARLETEISTIQFHLTTVFNRYLEVENGRDVLTRLFNRRFLPSVLSREIELSKRENHPFAVMLIDIDHFKRVNDGYGHDSGDVVLQKVSALIMNNVRAGDFVFRYGGEEILVVLVAVAQRSARTVAETWRAKVEAATIPLSGGRSLGVTVSIGVAAHDGHPDYQRLVARADGALYEAKNAGRNRCRVA
ncbi:MAG: GGDEF domain-containing protein [Telmatospirillum sp.]|nr:GGDEF domain-containing protein [Telmatospirillum sp.]